VSQKITSPIQRLRRDVATIGNGNLEHRATIKTGDEIEELADEFNKMTGALQNSYATLEQKVAQRTTEITALYEVTTAVNQSLSLKGISDAVIAKIVEIFRFDSMRIFLFDDRMEELQLQASFGVSANEAAGRRSFKRGQGVVGRVGDSGTPMIFEDINTDPRYRALSTTKATERANMSFFAVFPIKTKSRVEGAILFNAREPRNLSSEETRLLESMSEHLGVAVEKASLYRQSERRAQQLEVLNTIGAAVSQSLDLQIVLHQAIEKMIETLHFDACWIHMLNKDETELRLQACRGLTEEAVRALERRKLSEGLSGNIFQTGERLVFEDFQNDVRYHQISGRHHVIAMGFASAAGFPIKANDKTIGVLHLASQTRRQFAADELQHIESIAQEIGVAAQNARLFTEVNQKTAELQQDRKSVV